MISASVKCSSRAILPWGAAGIGSVAGEADCGPGAAVSAFALAARPAVAKVAEASSRKPRRVIGFFRPDSFKQTFAQIGANPDHGFRKLAARRQTEDWGQWTRRRTQCCGRTVVEWCAPWLSPTILSLRGFGVKFGKLPMHAPFWSDEIGRAHV